ncbi:MAG TPA: CocE/NonD family hydrolase C-terminal non-catalytic domain-containing protein, partial [Solirubrobacteraceae bacterium]
SHGFLDANARPDNILPLWSRLRGYRRAWFGQFPHVTPGQGERSGLVGRAGFAAEAFRFLDHALRGAPRPRDARVVVEEGTTGRWRSERRWPPDDVRAWHVRLRAGAYRDAPGNKGEPSCTPQLAAPVAALDPSCLPGPAGNGAWTVTRALRTSRWLAGAPRLTARLETAARRVHLHAFLYDVGPDGRATLISRGATLARSRTAQLELYPQDWRLAPGHRLAVLLSGADDLWFAPGTSLARVRLRAGHVKLPVLRRERAFDAAGVPSAAQRVRTRFPLPAGVVSPP